MDERAPVMDTICSASSPIVISLGLPRFTGPVKAASLAISRTRPVDQIVHITKGPRLRPVTVNRNGLVVQCLDDEIRHHASVVGMHARAVSIEYARHLDSQAVLAVVVEEQSLRAALTLVVAGPGPDGIHPAPVRLRLGMHLRIAVNLAGGGLQYGRPHPLGEPEHD